MTGGNPKGPSSSRKASSSHGKSRWESPKNPSSDAKPTTTDSSKPTIPSSKPKQSPTSLPGPSKPGSLQARGPGPFQPFPDPAAAFGPPPPPTYGFHMLDRRTIVLADGSVRSYFALPPDYQDFPPPPPFDLVERFLPPFGGPPEHGGGGGMGLGFDKGFPGGGGRFSPDGFRRGHREGDYWNSVAPAGEGSQQKRKYGGEGGGDERDERDEFARQRQQLLHYGNPNSNANNGDYLAARGGGVEDFRASKHMRGGGDYDVHSSRGIVGGDASLKNYHHDVVDPQAMTKSFLHYVKLLYENPVQKRNYLEDGKQRPLQCLTCGRFDRMGFGVHCHFLVFLIKFLC